MSTSQKLTFTLLHIFSRTPTQKLITAHTRCTLSTYRLHWFTCYSATYASELSGTLRISIFQVQLYVPCSTYSTAGLGSLVTPIRTANACALRKSSLGSHQGHRGFIGKFVWAHVDFLSLDCLLLTCRTKGSKKQTLPFHKHRTCYHGKRKSRPNVLLC